jgi:hypothetical protein
LAPRSSSAFRIIVVRRPKLKKSRLLTFKVETRTKHSIIGNDVPKVELPKMKVSRRLLPASQSLPGIVTHVERARSSSYESKIIEIIDSSPINAVNRRKNMSKFAAPASSSFGDVAHDHGVLGVSPAIMGEDSRINANQKALEILIKKRISSIDTRIPIIVIYLATCWASGAGENHY